MTSAAYYPPFEFKLGEEVYCRNTADFYFVKGMERKVGTKGYPYNLIYCESTEGEAKTFREWELGSNE